MTRKPALLAVAAALTLSLAAHAQAPSKVDKQLARIDIAISGMGAFNHLVSGPVVANGSSNTGAVVADSPSNTVGALVTIRYIASPLVGIEGNYTYARFTQDYNTSPFGVQAKVDEYSFGYVINPKPTIFGFQPFVSVGAGSTEFKPTPRGGESFNPQARATYYYSAGLQQNYLNNHFGLRASFRQAFFLAPDFGQNYLTIKKHTYTLEPTVGFFFRF